MKSKVVWLIVTGLMVTALVLASCGPAATTAPPTTAPPTTAPPTTPPPTTPKPTGEPQYGGTLTILHAHGALEPQTWDPYDYNWIVEVHASPYMEKLARGNFEEKGPRGTNEYAFTDMEYIPIEFLKPSLAESWEFPDPNTIIYHIRKGVMFPAKPGVMAAREMTAEDVLYCMNRVRTNPKYEAANLEWYYSLTAPDKYTFVVKKKDYRMDWLLPYGWSWYTGIYPQELVKAGPKDWKNAVGTGPFMLKDYVSGATITYEKNPNYWGTAKIGGKEYKLPFVDRLVWPIIVDESTQLAALRTGKVDINEAVSYKYKATLAETNPELVRFRYLYTTFGAIAGRMDVKPFDDIRVRRALSMAIDRPAFINALQGGEAQILSGPYSAGWPESLYTPLEKLPQSARELFEYNPEKAKKLLTEAGYPTGFKTEMVISSTGTAMTDAASMLVDWWSKIGVTVALKPYDYAVYLSIQYGLTHKAMYYMSKGNGGPDVLWIIGRTPPYYWNPAMWNDKYVADTYEKARLTGDPVEAKKLLKELNVYMIDQCPYVILPVNYGYSYAWPWVKNWYGELNATVRAPGLIHAQIWIDRDLREKMIGKR